MPWTDTGESESRSELFCKSVSDPETATVDPVTSRATPEPMVREPPTSTSTLAMLAFRSTTTFDLVSQLPSKHTRPGTGGVSGTHGTSRGQ